MSVFSIGIACGSGQSSAIAPLAPNNAGPSNACGGIPAEPPANLDGWTHGGPDDALQVCIEYPAQLEWGEVADWRVTIVNQSEESVTIESGSVDALAELTVMSQQGQYVSDWRGQNVGVGGRATYTFEPGESTEFEASWQQRGPDGFGLAAGGYELRSALVVIWNPDAPPAEQIGARLRLEPASFEILPPQNSSSPQPAANTAQVCAGIPARPPDNLAAWRAGPTTDELLACVEYTGQLEFGQKMSWQLSILNQSSATVRFGSGPSGSMGDFLIFDGTGTPVSSWTSATMSAIIAILMRYELGPGESAGFSAEWPQLSNEKEQLPPGTYFFSTDISFFWFMEGESDRRAVFRMPEAQFDILPPGGNLQPIQESLPEIPSFTLPQPAAGFLRSCSGIPSEAPTVPVRWQSGSIDDELMVCLDFRSRLSEGEKSPWTFWILHQGDRPTNIDVSTEDALADLVISDLKGVEISRWSNQNFFNLRDGQSLRKPGSVKTFEAVWKPVSNDLAGIEPGDYLVGAEATVTWNPHEGGEMSATLRTPPIPFQIAP